MGFNPFKEKLGGNPQDEGIIDITYCDQGGKPGLVPLGGNFFL